MDKFKRLILIFSLLFIACDTDLFKNGDDDGDNGDKEAPQVSNIYSSSDDLIVNQGDTVLFWVNATNPEEGDLIYQWTANGGTLIPPVNKDSVHWRASNTGGIYNIQVDVSNDYETSIKNIDITVLSSEIPYVKIISPVAQETIIQNYLIEFAVECSHENGINEVRFFVNDSLYESIDEVETTSDTKNYIYNWQVDAPAGNAELKVEAESHNPSAPIGVDIVNVIVAGMIVGKK